MARGDSVRFIVHDEDGPLRQFWTRAEAEKWMLDGMRLVVLPKQRRRRPVKPDWFVVCGEALL